MKDDFKEKWKDVTLKTRVKYCVSNLGRIAAGSENDKSRKILLQEDLKDKTGRDRKGYLVISYKNELPNLNHSKCIYEFIANAFFDKKENQQVHHIDNNGYDCRPCNLIMLKPRQHSKVHGFFVFDPIKISVKMADKYDTL